jgi:hypothetical protein
VSDDTTVYVNLRSPDYGDDEITALGLLWAAYLRVPKNARERALEWLSARSDAEVANVK